MCPGNNSGNWRGSGAKIALVIRILSIIINFVHHFLPLHYKMILYFYFTIFYKLWTFYMLIGGEI